MYLLSSKMQHKNESLRKPLAKGDQQNLHFKNNFHLQTNSCENDMCEYQSKN